MAYVHQWEQTWHYTDAYSGATLCEQRIDDWTRKAYFSKELREGEELCEKCAAELRARNNARDEAPPPRSRPFRRSRAVPTFKQMLDYAKQHK